MSATRTKDGKRAVIMECPDCKILSVMDPSWEGTLTFDSTCDNCMDYDKVKVHVVFTVEIPRL